MKLRSIAHADTGQKTCEGSVSGHVVENNCHTPLNVTRLLDIPVECSAQPSSTPRNSNRRSRNRRKKKCQLSSAISSVSCQQSQVQAVALENVPKKKQEQAAETHVTPINRITPCVMKGKGTPCSVSQNPLKVCCKKSSLSVSLHRSASNISIASATRELVSNLLRSHGNGSAEKSYSLNSILPDNRNQVSSAKVVRTASSALTQSGHTMVGTVPKLMHASSIGVAVAPSVTSDFASCSTRRETSCVSSAQGVTSELTSYVNSHSTALVSKQSEVLDHCTEKVQHLRPGVSISSDDRHSEVDHSYFFYASESLDNYVFMLDVFQVIFLCK